MIKLFFVAVIALVAASGLYFASKQFLKLPFVGKIEIAKYGVKCTVISIIALSLVTALVTLF